MQKLYVCSYAGTITSLEFTQTSTDTFELRERASTTACSPNPSWITLDTERGILYATEGGMSGKGSLVAFKIQSDGSFVECSRIPTPIGAAYHILYNNGKALGIPFYYSGVVGTYDVEDPSQLRLLQEMTFEYVPRGQGRSQDQNRPHHTMIDPTGKYALVADLGADLIRVLEISDNSHHWKPVESLKLPPESYARHVALLKLKDRTQMYILTQDTNSILSYKVDYLDDGLGFHKEEEFELKPSNPGDYPRSSHLVLSPDKRFLIASVRGDASYHIKSPIDGKTDIAADSVVSYSIDQSTGALTLADVSCSGGDTPRQFVLNSTGDKIAIVAQHNGWISIFDRDVATGKIGKLLAIRDGFGEMGSDKGPVCIIWDDREST